MLGLFVLAALGVLALGIIFLGALVFLIPLAAALAVFGLVMGLLRAGSRH
jgi:hypothetical protein